MGNYESWFVVILIILEIISTLLTRRKIKIYEDEIVELHHENNDLKSKIESMKELDENANGKIKRISTDEALTIVESGLPLGKFYHKEGRWFAAIDNSTGETWCDDFETKEDCIKWLLEYEKVIKYV